MLRRVTRQLKLFLMTTSKPSNEKPFDFYLEHEQLDSCEISLNSYIKINSKYFTYKFMEQEMDILNHELNKLNCNIVLWKEGHYEKNSNQSILDNCILKINNPDTLVYKLRISVGKKPKV